MIELDAKRVSFETLIHVDPNSASPRLGQLSVKDRKDLPTPNFIAVSSRGVVPHMTPDVILASSQIGGVHMALEDFVEKAASSTPPILNCPGEVPLHTFTALPTPLITLLAPRRTPAVTAPNGNTNTAISIFTSTGFQVLSNEDYVTAIRRLHPDIAIALADVPYGTLPGTKRLAKMGARTQAWVTELLSENHNDQAVFVPILPIDALSQSEYFNYLAEDQVDQIAGLAFYDSNLLPDIPATTSLLRLPRLSLDEPKSPYHILRQISLGIDIFTIPFIGFATDAGIALTFRFPQPPPESTTDETSIPAPLGIDMWTPTHASSLLPLLAACECYTCTSHHRAFIQHLLSAKEMLGWVLLQIHNYHILSEFFGAIRDSIKNGTFDPDTLAFERTYENELPEKSGQGPRVRGYHFKSEGPGQTKQNTPAWGNLGGDNQVNETPLVPDEGAAELQEKRFAEIVDEAM